MTKNRTQLVTELSLRLEQCHFNRADLTTALQTARDEVVELLAAELKPAQPDEDVTATLGLALDCLDFAVEYSREEPCEDVVREYRSAIADVIHTLRSSFLH